jgi:SAM-dependent methyltransferase
MCGSRDLHLILRMTPTPPGDHYVTAEQLGRPQPCFPMNLMMCGSCALAQLPDIVDPELLYRDYIYNTSISLGLVQHFDRYAESVIARLAPKPGSLVVDVGSNDGTLLKGFKKRGMRVLGIDPAIEAGRMANEAGIETLSTFFTKDLGAKVKSERGAASIVTANNVFANIDDLDDLMHGVTALLAPDGTFVFETGYFPDLARYFIIDNIYHEHLSYYSVKPLARFFQRFGMTLAAVDYQPTKGGSIRGFVRFERAPALANAGDRDTLLARETADGFDNPLRMRWFTEKSEVLRRQVRDTVASLRQAGKTVVGYGASVGVTTLLYYFELGKALAFLVDDNPIRHGRYSPGDHLAVLPSDALYERNPDNILLLAWRYKAPIIKRHEQIRDKFLLPEIWDQILPMLP